MTLTGTDYTISGQQGISQGGTSAYCNDTTPMTLPSGVTPQVYLNGVQVGTNVATTTTSQTVYQTHSSQCTAGGTFSQTASSIECDVTNSASWPCGATTGYGLDTNPQAQDYSLFDGLSLGITSSGNWYFQVQGSSPVKIATAQSVSNGDIIKISWTSTSDSSLLLPPPVAYI